MLSRFVFSLSAVTVAVSAALSSVIYECDYYDSSTCDDGDTNNGLKNYGSCYFSACGGHDIVISNFQQCDGSTYQRLYDLDGAELSYENDVYWDYDKEDDCSEISFALPKYAPCQKFESRVGCNANSTCQAQVTINVTDTQTDYVRDHIKHPEGNTWGQLCPKFNLSGTEAYYDPAATAVCSMELCPGHYYQAQVNDCKHSTVVEIFSYSDIQYTNYNLACVDSDSDMKVATLYFDTIGLDSCRLFSFYEFCSSTDPDAWCSGQVVIRQRELPSIDVQWTAESANVGVGDTLQFTLPNVTVEYDFWDFGEVSFWAVVYKTDMFKNQQHCGYKDFTHQDFFDYVGYFEWYLVGGTFTVLDKTGKPYQISNFGGEYTVVIYVWSDNFNAVEILSTSESLSIPGTSTLEVSMHEYGTNENNLTGVSGTWTFDGDVSVAGDVLVVVPVDHKGYCAHHGRGDRYDTAIYQEEMTAGALSGEFEFEVSHCFEHTANKPQYEIHYIRNYEVLGRILVANESIVGDSSPSNFFNTLGLEHLMVFLAIIGSVAFVFAFVVRKRQASQGYGGLVCLSSHDDDNLLNKDGGGSAL